MSIPLKLYKCLGHGMNVFADSFDTLQVFMSWSEDVHIVLIELSLFSQVELCHFPDIITFKVNT